MKIILATLSLFFLFFKSIGQDTTLLLNYPDGGSLIRITTKKDTFDLSYYSNNKLESTIQRNTVTGKIHYVRYYRNGKKMWDKQWSNQTENGRCIYFDPKGQKVAEFNYANGILRDTIYIAADSYILFGSLSYSSTVYGGMQREDGSSNVSTHSGPYIHSYMKFIELKPIKGKKPSEYYFTSDFNGDFFVAIKPGKYGLFSIDQDPLKIDENQFLPNQKPGSSWNDHWSNSGPVEINKTRKITYRNYEHISEGYAP
jgi:hypothetical protein